MLQNTVFFFSFTFSQNYLRINHNFFLYHVLDKAFYNINIHIYNFLCIFILPNILMKIILILSMNYLNSYISSISNIKFSSTFFNVFINRYYNDIVRAQSKKILYRKLLKCTFLYSIIQLCMKYILKLKLTNLDHY